MSTRTPLPEPDPKLIESFSREIGLLLDRLEPTPGPSEQLVVYAAVFSALCRYAKADPLKVIEWVECYYDTDIIDSHDEWLSWLRTWLN